MIGGLDLGMTWLSWLDMRGGGSCNGCHRR